jgi:hypothetical protein
MATPKLDGAGTAKMETLDAALSTLQTIHGIVEQMALSIRNGDSSTPHLQRIKRTSTPLVGALKGQFGMISDAVASMVLGSTRGASEQMRLRFLRENVASIRMQLEFAQKRVLELHMSAPDEQKPQGSR